MMVASGPGHSPAKAERHLAALEGAKLSGVHVRDANPVTVGEYARQWAGTCPRRPTTATGIASLISRQRLISGVPERVPVSARLEHNLTRRSYHLLAVLEHAEPTVEDDTELASRLCLCNGAASTRGTTMATHPTSSGTRSVSRTARNGANTGEALTLYVPAVRIAPPVAILVARDLGVSRWSITMKAAPRSPARSPSGEREICRSRVASGDESWSTA
jgi:hypothetical protein